MPFFYTPDNSQSDTATIYINVNIYIYDIGPTGKASHVIYYWLLAQYDQQGIALIRTSPELLQTATKTCVKKSEQIQSHSKQLISVRLG